MGYCLQNAVSDGIMRSYRYRSPSEASPQEVRDELAARAALQRQSMQEFLRCELKRIASRPSLGTWLQGVRDRKEAASTQVRGHSSIGEKLHVKALRVLLGT